MATAEGSDSITVQMKDAEFAARIRAGDREALQAVVHAYMSQILRAARGAGLSPQRAEDVTQTTFATFIEVAPRFEGRSHVRTFLFGILYKKIAEARGELQRDQHLTPSMTSLKNDTRPTGAGSARRDPSTSSSTMQKFEKRSAIASSTYPLRREWPLCFAKSKASQQEKFVRFWT